MRQSTNSKPGRDQVRADALQRRGGRVRVGQQLERAVGDERVAVAEGQVELRHVLPERRRRGARRGEPGVAAREHRRRRVDAVHLAPLRGERHQHAAPAAHDVERESLGRNAFAEPRDLAVAVAAGRSASRKSALSAPKACMA